MPNCLLSFVQSDKVRDHTLTLFASRAMAASASIMAEPYCSSLIKV